MQLAGHLLYRADQLLELGIGYRQRLDRINRRHATSDAIHAIEHALAPLLGELTKTEGCRQLTHRPPAKDKGIQQLALAAMQLFGIAGEFVVVAGQLVDPPGSVVVIAVVVDRVVPSGTTDPRTDILVGHIDFGEQVESIGDQPLVEIAVAIIVVDGHIGLAELAVAIGGSCCRTVLEGVIPANSQVRITGIELDGKRAGCPHAQRDPQHGPPVQRRMRNRHSQRQRLELEMTHERTSLFLLVSPSPEALP
ncbi:hypothetical protein D3C84_668230 [compost metagenome]